MSCLDWVLQARAYKNSSVAAVHRLELPAPRTGTPWRLEAVSAVVVVDIPDAVLLIPL